MKLFLIVFVIATVVLVAGGLHALASPPGNSECTSHPRDARMQSSPCLHARWEGIPIPLVEPGRPTPRLESFQIEARAVFSTCMVRNFNVNVRAQFILSAPDGGNEPIPLGFPVTTHALYGDHDELEEIRVAVNGDEVPVHAALDLNRYDFVEWHPEEPSELWYKGRLINGVAHPLLEEAEPLRDVAPRLISDGFDMMLVFQAEPDPQGAADIVIEYTTSSNDFSLCCVGVRQPAYSGDPYMFRFDLTNTRFWSGSRLGTVVLRDTAVATWSAVPDFPGTITVTPDTITLQQTGDQILDLAAPVQPVVFDIWPRRWPLAGMLDPRAMFDVRWTGGVSYLINNARVLSMTSTEGVHVDPSLPIRVDGTDPVERFYGSLGALPLSPPSYFTVEGSGFSGDGRVWLTDVTIQIPVTGRVVTGHELEILDLRAIPSGTSEDLHNVMRRLRAQVMNAGWYPERLIATVNVNGLFVESCDLGILEPHTIRWVTLPCPYVWSVPGDVEVELEPAAGEVNRRNNVMSICYPEWIGVCADPTGAK